MKLQMREITGGIEKLEFGIPGLDHIAMGGLPRGRTTLIAGTSGSAKTTLAVQYLAEGIKRGETGVFVTFEEFPRDIRKNMLSLGWNIENWEREGKWAFVNASTQPGEAITEAGNYDLAGLLVRIETAIKRVKATRVSLDSVGAVFSQFSDHSLVRRELFRITAAMKSSGVTTVLTAERTEEYGDITRFGVEEFVVDNVIILRNALEAEKRRRTIEILKFRGTNHLKGEFPFTVTWGRGLTVLPLSRTVSEPKLSLQARTTTGNAELDALCGGGLYRHSIVLLSGATGCGQTLLTSTFAAGVDKQEGPDERALLFAFEESREQLFRNAAGWGLDFADMERRGKLKVIATHPEISGLEDHFVRIKQEIDAFQPSRVAFDSFSALERVSTPKGYREFVIGTTSLLRDREITGMFTSTASNLSFGDSVTEQHISTIADTIIVLRYVEMLGEIKRGLTVLKMRGSAHEREIREFAVDGAGMHIGLPFKNVTGILTGNPRHVEVHEVNRLKGLFHEHAGQ